LKDGVDTLNYNNILMF